MGENRKNTAYNLQIYIEIVDSQKVKFVNCKQMTWERIVSYTLQFTIYKFVNIVDSLLRARTAWKRDGSTIEAGMNLHEPLVQRTQRTATPLSSPSLSHKKANQP